MVASSPSLTSYLGTCLDAAWVAEMETQLHVSSTSRDTTTGQLEHPFLHAALPAARFQNVDPRMNDPGIYGDCMPDGSSVMGPGSEADGSTVTNPGSSVNGTIVVDLLGKSSQGIASTVFAILVAEVVRANLAGQGRLCF